MTDREALVERILVAADSLLWHGVPTATDRAYWNDLRNAIAAYRAADAEQGANAEEAAAVWERSRLRDGWLPEPRNAYRLGFIAGGGAQGARDEVWDEVFSIISGRIPEALHARLRDARRVAQIRAGTPEVSDFVDGLAGLMAQQPGDTPFPKPPLYSAAAPTQEAPFGDGVASTDELSRTS